MVRDGGKAKISGEGVGTFLINVGGVVAIPKQGVGHRSEIFE